MASNSNKKTTPQITGDISVPKSVKGAINVGGGSSDHNRLFNRDLENQHPISSITDLQSTLNSKLDSATTLPVIENLSKNKAQGL